MRLMAPPRWPRTGEVVLPQGEPVSTGLGRELSLRWHQAPGQLSFESYGCCSISGTSRRAWGRAWVQPPGRGGGGGRVSHSRALCEQHRPLL